MGHLPDNDISWAVELTDIEVLNLMWATGQKLYDLLIWLRDHATSDVDHVACAQDADAIAGEMEDAALAPRATQWRGYVRFAALRDAYLAQLDQGEPRALITRHTA